MARLAFISACLLTLWWLVLFSPMATAADISTFQAALERKYSTAHYLGDNYQFNSRDGWQTINVTNLQYKYSRSDAPDSSGEGHHSGGHHLTKRAASKSKSNSTMKKTAKKNIKPSSKSSSKSTSKSSATDLVKGTLKKVMDSLKAIGSPEPVTITWYTGHDLDNPSCWSNPTWSPTDESFACALTLDGWTDRPKCFKFIELCNDTKKCVFVRVVDSCAGCAVGSKHVDLTKGAFSQLADLGAGILTVQMRMASDPDDGWLEDLWGPKES
ncbi:hypothetical protein B0H21DRAFT_577374 [Amylocystis lapponica]|nr:hypothetical protein B0H21DRAFT_577374 [Amylocystis lapponica]